MIVYKETPFSSQPQWTLTWLNVCMTATIELLGVVASADGKADARITTRAQHCRNSFHRLREAGLSHPGLLS